MDDYKREMIKQELSECEDELDALDTLDEYEDDTSDEEREGLLSWWRKQHEARLKERTELVEALEDYDARTGITYDDHYAPDCPICGMAVTPEDEEEEMTYKCGHFVGVYNDWRDGSTEADRDDLLREATHCTMTLHQLGGQNEWFFRRVPGLDDMMTGSEVCARFNLSESAVRQAIYAGRIVARQSGATWLVRRADAMKLWSLTKAVLIVLGLAGLVHSVALVAATL